MNTKQTVLTNVLVAAEAKRWVIRFDELSPMERLRLERWLQESEVHRAEFEAARQEWQSLDFLQLLQGDPVNRNDPWVARKRVRRQRVRRYHRPMAAAATLAAVALAFWWGAVPGYHNDHPTEYRTAIGEQRTVALPDDSVVLLNTNTRLAIDFTGGQRTVRLDRGEAHFEVAHDPTRPFVVSAGGGIVRAVGTAFNVYVNDEQVEVIVTDGEVEITQAPERSGAAEPLVQLADNRAGPVQRLTEGHNATISHTIETAAAVDAETLERKLSWRHGMLEFVNAPLSEVIDEVGRYTVKSLVITDPELETYPVTIRAKTNNIDGLLHNLDVSTDAFEVTHVSENRVLISGARLH